MESYWFWVKGQGRLCHSVYKTLWARYILHFLPNHFLTTPASCGWWEEEPYWFLFAGWKVKVKFSILCIKPCGHDAYYSFYLITFKLHMHIVDEERRNPIDFRSRGQRSRSSLYIKSRGQDTDYTFCQITFKLHMQVMDDERRNPIDTCIWLRGQRSRSF